MLGVSLYEARNGITYIRHSFAARPLSFDTSYEIDSDIIDTQWMTHEEIVKNKDRLRGPLILTDVERFIQGVRIPLEQVITKRFTDEE